MWLAKSFLLFYFLLSGKCYKHLFPLLALISALCGIFPLQNFLHPLTSLSLSNSPSSFPLPSLRDGHLIHLTSWKDKYSLVECEAPASPLTQTGDEGKVSLSAELRRPNGLIKPSTQPDTDMKMAPVPHIFYTFYFEKVQSFCSVDSICATVIIMHEVI